MNEKVVVNEALEGQEILLEKLQQLLEQYKSQLKEVTLQPLGDSGFVIELEPVSNNANWLLCDFDDTLVDTSQAKRDRESRLVELFLENYPELSQEEAQGLVKKSYELYLQLNPTNFYYPEIHAQAVQAILQKKSPEINAQAEIQQIFKDSIYNPQAYSEMVPVLAQAEASLVIFTYGDPIFQLEKVLTYLQQHPEIQVNQIWLTQIDKGDFFKQVSSVESKQKIIIIDDDPCQLSSMKDSNPGINVSLVRSQWPNSKHSDTINPIDTNYQTLDGFLENLFE